MVNNYKNWFKFYYYSLFQSSVLRLSDSAVLANCGSTVRIPGTYGVDVLENLVEFSYVGILSFRKEACLPSLLLLSRVIASQSLSRYVETELVIQSYMYGFASSTWKYFENEARSRNDLPALKVLL